MNVIQPKQKFSQKAGIKLQQKVLQRRCQRKSIWVWPISAQKAFKPFFFNIWAQWKKKKKLEMTDRKRMKCWISSFNLFWSIFRTCWYRSVHSCEVTGSDPSIWTVFLLNLFSVCTLRITVHDLSTSLVYQGLLNYYN